MKLMRKWEVSSQPRLLTPDLVIAPNAKRTWLRKIGEELEEWVSCEDDAMSYKPIREAWAEAVKMKCHLEKEIATSCSQLVSSQEAILEKRDVAAEKVQRLTDMVQDIKDHLQKKREKKAATKPLRDEIKHELYQTLMNTPSPRYTRHAHAEIARKRIVFTLLYYTGARVNELRNVTYNDLMVEKIRFYLMGVIQEGRLKLVLHKQKDAIVRVLATVRQEEMKKLTQSITIGLKSWGFDGHPLVGQGFVGHPFSVFCKKRMLIQIVGGDPLDGRGWPSNPLVHWTKVLRSGSPSNNLYQHTFSLKNVKGVSMATPGHRDPKTPVHC